MAERLSDKQKKEINEHFASLPGSEAFSGATVGEYLDHGGQVLVYSLSYQGSTDEYVIKVLYKGSIEEQTERFNKINNGCSELCDLGLGDSICIIKKSFITDNTSLYCWIEKRSICLYTLTTNKRTGLDYVELAIRVAVDLLEPLDVLRNHNIVHRDIKINNLFLKGSYVDSGILLGDLGTLTHFSADHYMTTKNFRGTDPTIAPEWIALNAATQEGRSLDHKFRDLTKSDMYSLAATMYYLLNEKRYPYQNTENRFLNPTAVVPRPKYGSDKLKRIVVKALSLYPDDRYPSCKAMLNEIKDTVEYAEYINHRTTITTPVSSVPSAPTKIAEVDYLDVEEDESLPLFKRHLKPIVFAGLAAVLFVIIVSALAGNSKPTTDPSGDRYNGSDDPIYQTDSYDNNDNVKTTKKTESEDKNHIVVSKIRTNAKSIDAIESVTASAKAVKFVKHNGNLTKKEQEDSYTFTPDNSGPVRIELSGMQNNTRATIIVNDSESNHIKSGSYINNEGLTIEDAKAGQLYRIKVRQYDNLTKYTLTIGQPKVKPDISDATEMKDSIEYVNQNNTYSFTPPRDGRYRFEVSGMFEGCAVEVNIYNHLGEKVAGNSYCVNGDGATTKDTELKAGEKYTVSVKHYRGFSDYTLSIGQQKTSVDVTDATQVSDSMQFKHQKNIYTFTPTENGLYRLDFEGIQFGCIVELYVFNSLREPVGSNTYCANRDGLTLENLKANETYEIHVVQNEGTCPYTLNIGLQKPITDINSKGSVSDSVEFQKQRNNYKFIPVSAGNTSFVFSGLSEESFVELYVFNTLGEPVYIDTYCNNSKNLVAEKLVAGEEYTVQVRQASGFTDYTLTIR